VMVATRDVKVYAVEPSDGNCSVLGENVRLNRVEDFETACTERCE